MLIARLVAPAAAIVMTAGILAAAAPAYNPPVCTKSGREIGNGRAPGLLKAAEHSRSVSECIVAT